MNRLRAPGFTRNVLPAVAYTAALFVAGSWSQGPEIEPVFAWQDKLLHLLAFAGLEVLTWRALSHLWPAKGRSWLLGVSLAVSCAVGGLLELWQSLLPARQAELYDWFADIAGALLAVPVAWRFNAAASWFERGARAPASKR